MIRVTKAVLGFCLCLQFAIQVEVVLPYTLHRFLRYGQLRLQLLGYCVCNYELVRK
jgi:hypothetical protein